MKLWDSNLLIYLPKPQFADLNNSLNKESMAVSEISRLEVLGYHNLSDRDGFFFRKLFEMVTRIPMDQPIIEKAITLRQQKSMSIGDALIAATALTHDLVLLTHNPRDFAWIDGLVMEDPL